ncbi:hypothetical protein [Thomasclavelia cocleata]|jgi:hypothetical protein|uniref:hypothetical protein n=1 Tax=Thomasclavelia cocleata TaxID=69824 RepID=UPI00255B26B9|nr:hypothetical protein [Thomasclavelia cocleata]
MYNRTGYVMREYILTEWVKYVVLKVGLFESQIIDEENFAATDELGIMRFKQKYIRNDDYVIVRVEM